MRSGEICVGWAILVTALSAIRTSPFQLSYGSRRQLRRDESGPLEMANNYLLARLGGKRFAYCAEYK